jgi:hypothetical protein
MAGFSKTQLLPTLHILYVYAGFVRCLWGQNYQPWYLVSTFTQSYFLRFFLLWLLDGQILQQ